MSHCILIVEDHPDTREGLAELLRLSGYAVQTAADGQQGLAAACRQAPDLILTDIAMPIMDGIEMIRRLRGSTACQATPILVLSAFSDKASEAAGAGADMVLRKPVSPRDLLRTINLLL